MTWCQVGKSDKHLINFEAMVFCYAERVGYREAWEDSPDCVGQEKATRS